VGMYPYPCPTPAHISSVMSHTSVRELAIAESSIPSVNDVVVDGEGMRLGRPLVRVSALRSLQCFDTNDWEAGWTSGP